MAVIVPNSQILILRWRLWDQDEKAFRMVLFWCNPILKMHPQMSWKYSQKNNNFFSKCRWKDLKLIRLAIFKFLK